MKFRKKPVEIEAMQWDGTPDGGHDIEKWANSTSVRFDKHEKVFRGVEGKKEIRVSYSFSIRTLEGRINVSPKDWIICGVKNEFYPCKPDIFEATYELI